MANDGTTAAAPAAPAPAAAPATSENFLTAVRQNALTASAEPAAPAATPLARAATPATRDPRQDDESQFGGDVEDVPFDEQKAEPAIEANEEPATAEADSFIDAEVIDLDAEIHGVKARDLLAAIKAGSVPPDVAAKLGLSAPALDEVFFAEGEFPGMKGSEVLECLRTGAVMTSLI